ncbi:replication-relaxation family protein [Nocardia sp. NPDC004068]|uniref:replication-relaxation family protein n=1 Tax=Nocardia sp. NPDC004068 TaxID=3364303 RepID=UPI003689B3C5
MPVSNRGWGLRGLSPPQVKAVVALGRAHGPQTLDQVVNTTRNRCRSAVRRTLDRLVERGLATRWVRPGPGVGNDPHRWVLTDAGRDLQRALSVELAAQAARRRGHRR